MPASPTASYVGRFAPPGSPKTTSTPSAFRHSITASTARMRPTPFFLRTRVRSRLAGPHAAIRGQRGAQDPLGGLGRAGTGHEVALAQQAAAGDEEAALLVVLDALGDDVASAGLGEL